MRIRAGNRLVALALGGAVIAGVSLVSPAPASAYAWLDCKLTSWLGQPFTSTTVITYKYNSVSAAYVTAFDQGQYAWDTKAVPGSFAPTTGTPRVNIYDTFADQGYYAVTTYKSLECASYGSLQDIRVTFNNRLLDGRSSSDKRLVAIHELGHVYGLADVGTSCTYQLGPAIMRGDATLGAPCGGSPPYADDINGVNARY